MRRIGTISQKEDAERFRDYLLTQQTQSQIEEAGDEWAVWVHDEDKVESSREELQRYLDNPRDERYQKAIVAADRIRHEKIREAAAARKKQVDLSRHWNRPLIRQIPVTFTLVVISVIVFLGTRFGENLQAFGGQIPIVRGMQRTGDYTTFPSNFRQLPGIADGEIWRLFTPAFLHFGPLHLLMNMYMLTLLGGRIERVRGSRTMLGLFLITAAVGNLAQLYVKGPFFGGMSGVDSGLFGYMWIKGQMEPESGMMLPPNFVFLILAFLLIATTGYLGPIANWAHFGGLGAGIAVAAGGTWWRRLQTG